MGDARTSTSRRRLSRHDGYFRLPKPALICVVPAAHAQPRQGAVHGSDLPRPACRLGAPGPARVETISCVSNYQFGWHITYPYADDVAPLLPAGTIVHMISWHDNTPANK
jgi:hypothetical protein